MLYSSSRGTMFVSQNGRSMHCRKWKSQKSFSHLSNWQTYIYMSSFTTVWHKKRWKTCKSGMYFWLLSYQVLSTYLLIFYFINLRNIYLLLQIYALLPESTVSIVCRHISQFQSTSVPETPSFLRILTTKMANVTKCKIKLLEQPNIVFGVGAGGLC